MQVPGHPIAFWQSLILCQDHQRFSSRFERHNRQHRHTLSRQNYARLHGHRWFGSSWKGLSPLPSQLETDQLGFDHLHEQSSIHWQVWNRGQKMPKTNSFSSFSLSFHEWHYRQAKVTKKQPYSMIGKRLLTISSTNLSQNIAQLRQAKTVRKLFICGPTKSMQAKPILFRRCSLALL